MHRDSLITHVIFDLDGLLISSEEIYTEIFSKFLTEYGKMYTYDFKRKLMGRKSLEAAAMMIDEYKLPFSPQQLSKLLHERVTPDVWLKAQFMPGVVDVIDFFHTNSIPMAIATGSSSSEIFYKTTRNKEIWSRFHHFVASSDDPMVIHGKPAPDIFQVALSRFEDPLAKPEHTLVFEDAWNGVVAGIAAGMRVVWVPDMREQEGLPNSSLSECEKARIFRLSSLLEFNPADFNFHSETTARD